MKHKIAALFLALMCLGLAACGGSSGQQAENTPLPQTMPVLHLWGIGGNNPEDVARIAAVLNQIAQEKYGFSVNLTMVSRSNYNEQLNLAFLRGEAPDVFAIYQQPTFNDLYAAGRLLCLNDWADDAWFESLGVPTELWPRTLRNGRQYGVVQNTETLQGMGYELRSDIAAEFGVPDSALYTWDELHELLLRIKAAYPDQYPIVPHYGATLNYIGQDTLGDDLGVLIDERSTDATVVNLYASEAYYDFCSRMHQWYQEGLILPDSYDGQINGFIQISSGLGSGMFQRFGSAGTRAYAMLWLSQPSVDSFTTYVLWGINSKSEYPVQAMSLLQALFTDPEICELLILGQEGVDYLQLGSGTEGKQLRMLREDWAGNSWAWPGWTPVRQSYAAGTWPAPPEGITFIVSPAYGFVFDAAGLEKEVLRCKEVVDKYHSALTCGFLDPDTAIPLFLQELEQAGINRIIAEKQRQLDDWLAQADDAGQGRQ